MADEKDVVRVTFKDLEQIARQNKLSYANGGKEGLPSDAQKRRAKRPERSIYRPGVSRLRKTSGSQEENDTGASTGRLSPAESMAQVSEDLSSLTLGEADFAEDGQKNNTRVPENTKHEAAGKPRRKRPDIQIYVPKGKLAEKDLDTCSQSEGVQYPGGDDEFEMSPNLNTENVTGSEEEISPPLTEQRKVNLVKAKDRQISVTVVSQERKSPIGNTSLNEDDHTSSFLKTMIFERGGSGLQHDSKQSHKDNRTFTDTDKQEQITSDKGLRALNEQRRDEEEKMRTDQNRAPAGTESPSGKNNSKRYSLAKRKGKGRRNNNHIDSDQKEDPVVNVKELATSNSELDSDVPLDEIEKLSPLVLDWGEEVERELGTEDENPLENNDSARSSKSRTKSRRRRRKNSENRARNSEGKDFDNKSESKQTTDSTSKVRDSSYRRSSLDSATWTNNTENRPARADSDAESDVTDHPNKRKRNRQRERKRTRSGPGNVNHQDSLGLRVTVDRNARQVQVNDSPQQRRPNYHSSHEHLSSDSDFAHSPKGGGILHLASPNISHPEHRQHRERDRRYNSKAAHRSHEHLPPRGDNRSQPQRERKDSARGNTGGQRTLFDPSNPSKPIVIQSASTNLQFTESGPQGPPGQFDGPHNQQFTGRGHYPSYGRSYSDAHYQPYSGGEQFYYSYPGAFQESSALRDDTYAQDPYYHSGYDPDYVIGGMSRSQCRAMADHIMRDASPLDSQLTNILSRRLHSDSQPLIKKLRHELKTAYEQVVLLDPDLANKHNVEQMLWKNVFYQVIEVHRRHLGEDKQATPNLIQLLDEADGFYEALLQKLQHTYNFRLEPFLNPAHPPPENLSRAVKLALLSSQRTMICLGDIARYREQAHGKVNYGKARSWYMKAQQIAPKNGRPYNQLAILALYTKRKLDAVYYYMRSLAASNPFLTARESLMSLFDEARKKAEATDAKKHEEREKLLSWRRKRQKEGPRVEVWVGADGRSHTGEVDETADEDLSNLAPVELNKRLSLSFLNAHGKLFTKIGMEHFELVSYQLLCEYQAVLAHRPPIVSNNRLLQLAAINMFSVDNTALKGERIEDNCRSLLQEHAVQQGLDMFAVLAARFTALLQAHLSTKDYPGRLLSDDLRELVPSIKVWSDWMMCHPTLWNPAPNLHDPDNSFKIDTWKETAEMLNILKEVDITHVKLYRDKREGCESVILEEDLALAGFVPLLSAPSQAIFVHATVEKHIAKDCLRIQKLQTFGDYLCGIEPPMLAYNVETKRYYSVAPSVDYSTDEESKSKGDNSDVEDVIIESEECEALSEEEGETGVSELRAKKEQLQQRLHERTKRKENVEAILEKHRHRAIELRICPVFLVPDTNCFINHLAGMRKLLSSRKYTLVIPLVVINELDGLSLGGSRGGPQHSGNHHHMARVGNQAKLAVDLLETEFGRRNPHLRALTSKGNSLETIAFRSEETDNLGVNDDLILSCCLHYCKDMAKDFMPKTKDTPIVLQRDVVLLTDDRNLRLKAHTRNVPVKDVPSFLNWANIT